MPYNPKNGDTVPTERTTPLHALYNMILLIRETSYKVRTKDNENYLPALASDLEDIRAKELEELNGLNTWLDNKWNSIPDKATWKQYALLLEYMLMETQASLETLTGERAI